MAQIAIIENIERKGRLALLTIPAMAGILLDKDTLKKHSIQIRTEIRLETLKEIVLESDCKRAKDYVIYLLSRQGYSYGLLKEKMQKKGYQSKAIDTILAEFQRLGLIDDAQFARQAVESLLHHKPAGRSYLIAYLQAKHIPRQLANSVVDELLRHSDEAEMAVRLLRGRWRYLAKFELETARRKAYNYLSRRSIGYGPAKLAFKKLLKEECQD